MHCECLIDSISDGANGTPPFYSYLKQFLQSEISR